MGTAASSADELVRAIGAAPPQGSTTIQPLNRQYHTDGQGSVQFTSTLTDVTEVDVAIQPFGQQQLGVLTNSPFAFGARQGYRTDPDSGFIYVRNRWLDPSTGRWLSRDPVEGEHPYGFADNNPVLFSDPDGGQAVSGPGVTRGKPDRRARHTSKPPVKPERQGWGHYVPSGLWVPNDWGVPDSAVDSTVHSEEDFWMRFEIRAISRQTADTNERSYGRPGPCRPEPGSTIVMGYWTPPHFT